MSEKDKKPINPLGKPGLNKSGKPKFNSYWIVGIILLVLLGVQLLNNTGNITFTLTADIGDFKLLSTEFEYSANAVPIPAAAWLFGTGIFALVGIRRKFA